jgi:hypothetical protein
MIKLSSFRSFGGFAFDRVRGKPVTLDIGFGPFKTRVIGPKDFEKKEGQMDYGIDLENTKPAELPLAIFSGCVKVTGDIIGVSKENIMIQAKCCISIFVVVSTKQLRVIHFQPSC